MHHRRLNRLHANGRPAARSASGKDRVQFFRETGVGFCDIILVSALKLYAGPLERPRLNGGLLPRVALSLRAQMIGIMRRRCLPCVHEVGRMGGRREHGRCGTEEKAFHAEISWLSARCCGRSKTSS
jgi:hypothetical protein